MYSRIKQLNRFTDMIQIRPSQLSDLDRLMEIFDHARKFMASVGNGNQWINGYPQRELIAKESTDGYMLMATGDVKWADKMESAVYNAALGAINKDFKALQYFSSPNQLLATEKSSMAPYGEEGLSRQAYRPGFDVECCSGNVHRMFPNYISRMWVNVTSMR